MGLAIVLVFPDGQKTYLMTVAYSSFGALRAVVKFNETPTTAAMPGSSAFHDHSDSTGDWTTQELSDIALYLEAILDDRARKPQRNRAKILHKMEAERQRQLDDFTRALRGGESAMFPATFPGVPKDEPEGDDEEEEEEEEEEEDADGESSDEEVKPPPLLALPPSLHFAKMRNYDEWLRDLVQTLKDAASKKAKAKFC